MNDSEIRAMRVDPAAFRASLRLNNGHPWVLDAWQDEFFKATDAGWQRAIGRTVDGGFSRAWSVRPRGHSKTHDIGSMVAWAILASPRERPVKGVVAAGDEDQARLVADAVRRIVRANAWLGGYVEVQRGRVYNPHTESECTILASDAPSSLGLLPDFIICDELTCWRNRELWDSLFSAAAKQSHTFLAVLGNAGHLDSWQFELWQKLQSDPAWHCHSLPGPVASWISPAALAEQQRVLPTPTYQRLWLNIWVRGDGDAIALDDIEVAKRSWRPIFPGEPGIYWGIGLDLGTKRDHSAMAVVGADTIRHRVTVAEVRSWKPSAGLGVAMLQHVRAAVIAASRKYANCGVLCDPNQAYLMIADLHAAGIECVETPFSAPRLAEMATATIQAFRERKIDIPDDAELIADLQRLNIADRAFGVRLTAPSDPELGHCDRAIALSIVLPGALKIALSGEYAPPPPQQLPDGRDPTWGLPVAMIDSPYPNMRDEYGRGRR